MFSLGASDALSLADSAQFVTLPPSLSKACPHAYSLMYIASCLCRIELPFGSRLTRWVPLTQAHSVRAIDAGSLGACH